MTNDEALLITREELRQQISGMRDDMAGFRADVLERFGMMGQRSIRLEVECQTIKSAIGRLENRIAALEKALSSAG